MKVRTRAPTRIAHQGDGFTPFYMRTLFLEHLLDMAIAGYHSETVFNGDHIAHQPLSAGIGYQAVCRCNDRRSCSCCDVKSPMKFTAAGKGGHPVSESR